MPFVKVATVDQLPEGAAAELELGGKKIGLFNVGGKFYAIDNLCPHRGAPLSDGYCEGTDVVCPLHSAKFDLCTGLNKTPPAKSPVKTYRTQVTGVDLEVEL